MLREIVGAKKRFYVGFCNMSTQEKVYFWASRFPYDIWWRNKYHIPFLSLQHRQMSFEAMKFAWHENKMIQDIINKPEEKPLQNNQVHDELQNEIASMSFDEVQQLLNGN